jgi:hypothetical protein
MAVYDGMQVQTRQGEIIMNPMPNPDAFKPRNYDQSAEACRAALGTIAWSEAILDHWPVPVAFEYWRLREELTAGQPLAAMHQLKDLAEVLIKFPVVAAGKLLILHGDDRQQAIARDLLVSQKPPSMDIWRDAGPIVIRTACELDEQHLAPWCSVIELAFSRESFHESTLWHQLGKLVPWRNKEIGHGALRLDLHDLAEDLLEQILRMKHRELGLRAATPFIVVLDGLDELPAPDCCPAAISCRGAYSSCSPRAVATPQRPWKSFARPSCSRC